MKNPKYQRETCAEELYLQISFNKMGRYNINQI